MIHYHLFLSSSLPDRLSTAGRPSLWLTPRAQHLSGTGELKEEILIQASEPSCTQSKGPILARAEGCKASGSRPVVDPASFRISQREWGILLSVTHGCPQGGKGQPQAHGYNGRDGVHFHIPLPVPSHLYDCHATPSNACIPPDREP